MRPFIALARSRNPVEPVSTWMSVMVWQAPVVGLQTCTLM